MKQVIQQLVAAEERERNKLAAERDQALAALAASKEAPPGTEQQELGAARAQVLQLRKKLAEQGKLLREAAVVLRQEHEKLAHTAIGGEELASLKEALRAERQRQNATQAKLLRAQKLGSASGAEVAHLRAELRKQGKRMSDVLEELSSSRAKAKEEEHELKELTRATQQQQRQKKDNDSKLPSVAGQAMALNKRLLVALKESKKLLEQRNTELGVVHAKADEEEHELKTVSAKFEEQSKELKAARAQADKEKEELQTVKATLASQGKELSSSGRKVKEEERELKAKLLKQGEELSSARAKAAEEEQELRAQLAKQGQELKAALAKIHSEQAELKAMSDTFASQGKELKAALADAEEERRELRADNATVARQGKEPSAAHAQPAAFRSLQAERTELARQMEELAAVGIPSHEELRHVPVQVHTERDEEKAAPAKQGEDTIEASKKEEPKHASVQAEAKVHAEKGEEAAELSDEGEDLSGEVSAEDLNSAAASLTSEDLLTSLGDLDGHPEDEDVEGEKIIAQDPVA